MAHSSAQLLQSQQLHAEANVDRTAAEQERSYAEDATRQLIEQRKAFEAERLETAKQRKDLMSHKTSVARSAEATRLLQLQLVEQIVTPSAADARDPDAHKPSVPATTAAPQAVGDFSAASQWRRWVKPQAKPQPIPARTAPPLGPVRPARAAC